MGVEEPSDGGEREGGLMVGEIESLRKIPKKERYSVCMVRVRARRTIQIVTNAPVTEKSRVAVAVAPCVIPAQDFTVERRKVQKEDSEGMFLGPEELGWGADCGFDLEKPVPLNDFAPGAPIPTLAELRGGPGTPEEAKPGKGKKKKGKKQDEGGEEDLDALLAEFKVDVAQGPGEGVGKKKKGKAQAKQGAEDKGKETAKQGAEDKGKEPAPAQTEAEKAEEIDALIAQLEAPPAPEDEAGDAEGAEGVEGAEDVEGAEISAKTLANRRRKERKKAKKGGGEGLWGEEEGAAAPVATEQGEPKDAKGKAKRALAAKALERVQAIKELEEEKQKFEDEQRRLQEEEDLRIAEEEKIKEEKRLKRKAQQAAKKERMEREGIKVMSKAERERQAQALEFRKQLEEAGCVMGEEKDVVEVTEEAKGILTACLEQKDTRWTMKEEQLGLARGAVLDVAPSWRLEDLAVGDELNFKKPKKKVVYESKKKKRQEQQNAAQEGTPEAPAEERVASPAHAQARAEAGASPAAGVKREKKEEGDTPEANWESMSISEPEPTKVGARASGSETDSDSDSNSDGGSDSGSDSSDSDSDLGLRSPICCIMGHVDTGKTKLLDKIRRTNVQEGEAGGITQQIGATYFPEANLVEQSMKVDKKFEVLTPGLLIIDTPGHESFNNLRKRGSSLCDIAILVVDIMHGLEPQTIESLEMLRQRKCPFIIALNKVDRLYEWRSKDYVAIRESLPTQEAYVRQEFEQRYNAVLVQLAEKGLNCALYWENDDLKRNVSIIPTSAITGEGVPDLLYMILRISQDVLYRKIEKVKELQCTVLEVKKNTEGFGTSIDVVLVNGKLHEGDTIVVCGLGGPIATHIRALLTPQPMKEMRVKGDFIHHKSVSTSMGLKIVATGLEEAVAGTSLYVCGPDDDLEEIKDDVMEDFDDIINDFDKATEGVYVMASTLGALEALLAFLKESKIPVFAVNIGEVHQLDVKKASLMREKKHPEYSVILAFDVKVNADARKLADSDGVKIMTADIIYHLFDMFTAYMKQIMDQKKKDMAAEAVFPVWIRIRPEFVIRKRDPIIIGVDVVDGAVRIGTPICVPEKNFLEIGRVAGIERERKAVESARKGQSVCIKIEPNSMQQNIALGRQFEPTDELCSAVTRRSIDCLKEYFREEMTKQDWQLIIELKKLFEIP